jgi:hypothetical protein
MFSVASLASTFATAFDAIILPTAKLTSWLRGLPGVDAVTVEAFPVEPASGP